MKAEKERAGKAPAVVFLDEVYLRSFGEIRVPLHLWRSALALRCLDRAGVSGGGGLG